MLKKLNKKAFTLIELLVVIAVVGILILLGMPRFIGYNKDAEVTAMQQDIKVLSDAALQAHVQTGDWPVNEVSHSLVMEDEELDLKGLDEDTLNQYVKSLRWDFTDYAIYTDSGAHEGDVFFIGNDGKGLTDRHDDTYYGLEKDVVSVTPGDTELDDTPGDVEIDDTPGDTELDDTPGDVEIDDTPGDTELDDTPGDVEIETGEAVNENLPGDSTPIATNGDVKFFGEVPASELYTASEIASAVGITQGYAQNENEPWLKFEIDGSIIYRPRKSIRYNISWNSIHKAGAVFGTKQITKNGVTYKVRLMKGLRDGNHTSHIGESNHGSEWNRLMLPIHEQAIDKSWEYGKNVEDNIEPLFHTFGTGNNGMYTDADLVGPPHFGGAAGSAAWVQEERPDKRSDRVLRGNLGVSYSLRGASSKSSTEKGWAPVLEVVE